MELNTNFLARLEQRCWITMVLVVANGFACGLILSLLGGDGWRGYTDGDRYFLASRGVYCETNYWVFTYTKIHILFSAASIPVGAGCGILAAVLREHRQQGTRTGT